MALRDEIRSAQTEAMKQRDVARMNVLRMLWSAIRNEEIDAHHELSDAEIESIVARQVKQSHDAIKDFRAGNRADLVAQTEAEISLLQTYLPAQLSDEELQKAVDAAIAAIGKDAGKVGQIMGMVMKEVKGRADGNRVREFVQKRLT